MALPRKILELEFTVLEFHRDFVLSKPREGQILEAKEVAKLIEVCSDFFGHESFVYLSYRVNDYNVNPTVYMNLDEVKNLAGIGVVSKKTSSLKMASFEKNFCKLPFEIFTDLDDALDWTGKVLEEKLKKEKNRN
jgi:hypothetical protein